MVLGLHKVLQNGVERLFPLVEEHLEGVLVEVLDEDGFLVFFGLFLDIHVFGLDVVLLGGLAEGLLDGLDGYAFFGFAEDLAVFGGEIPEIGLGPPVDDGVGN